MDEAVKNLLTTERVSSLSVQTPNGVHSSAMHFSVSYEPSLTIYFSTDKTSRKCEFMSTAKNTKASFLIGFSETDWKTLQVDGSIEIVETDELAKVKENHYLKNPSSKKFENDPGTIFLKLIPSWWRYSDLGVVPPKIISNR